MNISDDKITALESAMNQIEKQFGKGSIMKLGANTIMEIEAIPTGCLALDIALGVGGVPRAEIEGDMGDSHMGLQARLMSQALRKLTGAINKSKCVVIFINQLREKIGIMFGNPETTTGGRALKFYSSIRLDIRRIDSIKVGENIVGNRTRIKVVKNKDAPPFKQAEFDIMYNEGISKVGNIIDIAVNEEIVQKSGAWFSYKDTMHCQGRENSKVFLKENPDIALEIENQIREKYNLPV